MAGGLGSSASRVSKAAIGGRAGYMVTTSPDRKMISSTPAPNATSRGSRTASLLPLRNVRLRPMEMIFTLFVFTREYHDRLHTQRGGDGRSYK